MALQEVLRESTDVCGFVYDAALAAWPPLVPLVRRMRMGERSRFRLEHGEGRWCEAAIDVKEVRMDGLR